MLFPAGSKEIDILSVLIAFYILDRKRQEKFIPRLFTCISFYLLSIHLFLFLSLCQSKFTPISFNPVFLSLSILLISTYICFYLSSIHLYFFIPFFQYKFTAISFKPVFFISLCSFYVHLYLFLSLVYPPLFLYISLLIQIDTYHYSLSLSQTNFHLHTPVSIFISFLSTTITFHLMFIQIYIGLFQSSSPNLSISLMY